MNSSLILVMRPHRRGYCRRDPRAVAACGRRRLRPARIRRHAVTDIAVAADVSAGALYAHFGSKAELLVAALRAHGRRLLAEVLAADPGRITDLLLLVGRRLPRRRDARGYLIVEALVAAATRMSPGRCAERNR